MRIVVTGAGGKLGSYAAETLIRAGHDVVALDRAQYRPVSFEVNPIDLLDSRAVADTIAGAEVVVHIGNIPNVMAAPPLTVIQNNLRINVNVIEAALDAGVRRMLFASSIQVISGFATESRGQSIANRVAYLPLDCNSPPNPANQYAISKRMTEVMLAEYAVSSGIQAVALRFPVLTRSAEESELALGGRWWRRRGPGRPPHAASGHPHPHPHPHRRFGPPLRSPNFRAEGMSYLPMEDASDLVAILAEQDVPGYRQYMPALCRLAPEQVPEVVQAFYPGVPLTIPREQMTSLVDSSAVMADTGWRPQRAREPIVIPQEVLTGTE